MLEIQSKLVDMIAMIGLSLMHVEVILPIVALYGVLLRNLHVIEALCLLCFSMVSNPVLKAIFKVPLNPALHIDGFAFPSGHMQGAIAFYGWLYFNARYKSIQLLCLTAMLIEAWTLIYHGYHDFIDILGAIAFGVLILFGIYRAKKHGCNQSAMVLAIAGGAIIVFVMFVFVMARQFQFHSNMAFGVLLGLSIGFLLFGDEIVSRFNFRAPSLSAFCVFILSSILLYLSIDDQNIIKWMMFGISLICHDIIYDKVVFSYKKYIGFNLSKR